MMKNLLLLIFCFSIYHSYSQNVEELKNGNFEKWSDEYQTRPYPVDWGTSLEDDALVKSILRNDTAPHGGKHSIRLINVTTSDGRGFFGDLHMGIYTGNPQSDQYIPYPYDEKMEVFKGFVKPRFGRGDSASVFFSFITHDTIRTDTIFTFSGDTFNWVGFEFELPELDTVPQQMLMLLANANLNDLGSSSPLSFMDLDDLQFLGADNKDLGLVNGDFEDWVGEDLTYHLPNYWWTLNKIGLEKLGVKAAPVQKTEESVEGDFALKLITQPQTKGLAAYGNVQSLPNGALKFSAIPYTGQPKYIKGSYKYTELPNGDGNGASLYYEFRKNGRIIDRYQIPFTADSTGDFKEFSEALFLDNEPDSVMIVIQSGDSIGSSVIIDNLYFEGEPNSADNLDLLSNSGLNLSPNPYQSGDLTISFSVKEQGSIALTVTDLTGKVVYQNNGLKARTGYNEVSVDLPTQLKSGFYICSVQSGGNIKNSKLLIEK